MTRKSLEHLNCSWAQAAEAIGDKWSIMIVRDAFFGVKTFSAFADNLGISKNILTQRLEHLIKHGVLAKRPIGLGTSRSEYTLTDKGQALFPIMIGLAQWSDEWVFGNDKEPYNIIDKQKGAPIQKVRVTDTNGCELSMADVTLTPGKGANANNRRLAEEMARNERLADG
ncbi:winged helix-turn-helix transcriptional regulator [Alterisphingorhabdus coralli]|uniref:Helix-turn-helix domain-containing protein n=1 Tax=Alterisphingorhabdus coralli TaxID=3071408 RepID=A0AA97F8Z9_9SPHN|nr:helix-turn-helix domain-containing protein [Parasphingorhabdus sp. SCSIO 66989]WOE74680.1 helix-turn-helix domain-containing protein [Parasphingorhabdus sp. SCSIO 66989]